MTQDEVFVKYTEIFSKGEIGKELEDIVNVEDFKKTPAAPTKDSGLAYDGAIMYHIITVWHYANKLKVIYDSIAPVDVTSLAKVIALQHLGKVGMFEPNKDEWQTKKLGKVYGFVEKDVCLKNGELSKLVCSNAGVKFTTQEYEAMTILDKTPEEYEAMTKYRTHLSTIIKMANDLAYAFARERHKKQPNI